MSLIDSIQSLPLDPGPVAVAVSGGGDSMALLHLAARYSGRPVHAVTVDHGLRDVWAELELVANAARELDVPHTVLRWDWDGQGSLQAQARAARKVLISEWALDQGITRVLLGHTRDDQAETVLLRLARGSGVDGLAAMQVQAQTHGVTWHRPLLGHSREALRDWLRAHDISWAEDPSNDDPRFDRVRARQMMQHLTGLGLTPDRLVQTADHAGAARRSLQRAARDWVRDHAQQVLGCVRLDGSVLDLSDDTPRRVLAGAVQWAGRSDYRPSWGPLQAAAASVQAGQVATLGGCLLLPQAGDVIVAREPNAAPVVPWQGPATTWDGWSITGPDMSDAQVAPVGDAISQVDGWRGHGLPHAAARGLPGIWQGNELIAAPALAPGEWDAQIAADFTCFFDCR